MFAYHTRVAAQLMPLSTLASPAGRPIAPETHPVHDQLAPLFPFGGLIRGSVVSVGSPALALALLAPLSHAGSWCAATGLPGLGLAAAADAGIDLRRLVLVPRPAAQWATAVATQLDGFDAILLRPPQHASHTEARRLAARARERRSTLLLLGTWPQQVDLDLRVERSVWSGLHHGYGRLTEQECTIAVRGRGAAARERRATVRLPLALPLTSHSQPEGVPSS